MALPSSRHVSAILIAFIVASAGWVGSPEAATACTGTGVSPTDSAVSAVVLGRVTSTEYLAPSQAPDEPLTLRLSVEVERYLWGTGPSTVTIEDSSSAYGDPDNPDAINWLGPCRAFAEEPTGKLGVFALPSDGARFDTFMVYGLGQTCDEVQSGVEWVEEQLALASVTPASAGHGVEASAQWGSLWLGILAVALLGGARRISRR